MRKILMLSFALIVVATVAAKAAPAIGWDSKLNSTNGPVNGCGSDRFTCVLDGEAVRDNETGLVWQREPIGQARWADAFRECWLAKTGGRMGWHLPTVEQLSSLIDADVLVPPFLPAEHPFIGVGVDPYWTASPDTRPVVTVPQSWFVTFENGGTSDTDVLDSLNVWCVRGDHGLSPEAGQ